MSAHMHRQNFWKTFKRPHGCAWINMSITILSESFMSSRYLCVHNCLLNLSRNNIFYVVLYKRTQTSAPSRRLLLCTRFGVFASRFATVRTPLLQRTSLVLSLLSLILSNEIKFQEIDQILQAFIETFPYEWTGRTGKAREINWIKGNINRLPHIMVRCRWLVESVGRSVV